MYTRFWIRRSLDRRILLNLCIRSWNNYSGSEWVNCSITKLSEILLLFAKTVNISLSVFSWQKCSVSSVNIPTIEATNISTSVLVPYLNWPTNSLTISVRTSLYTYESTFLFALSLQYLPWLCRIYMHFCFACVFVLSNSYVSASSRLHIFTISGLKLLYYIGFSYLGLVWCDGWGAKPINYCESFN